MKDLKRKEPPMKANNDNVSDNSLPKHESFNVEIYQLAVSQPSANWSGLYIQLRGNAEGDMTANYAEIYFVEDDAERVPQPQWAGEHNRIRVFYRRWQFPHIVEILRSSKGTRCFFFSDGEKPKNAGIKDWNAGDEASTNDQIEDRIPLQVPRGNEKLTYYPMNCEDGEGR